jgi:thiamine kinase-like enzyme
VLELTLLSAAVTWRKTITTKVLTNVDQITTEWLTAVLTKSDAITEGAVASFERGQGQGNWSTNASLKVTYTPEASGSLPQQLFLKMVDTEASTSDEYFSDSEVTYYTRDYLDLSEVPLLRCYDAAYSDVSDCYHLLLDDLSETHVEAAEKEPTLEYGLALAEGLAHLHSHWWGAERLAEANAPLHSPEHIQRFVSIAEPGVDHILNRFSAELEPHWPARLRELYAKHPRAIIERARDSNGFTLIHGDVGHNNILVPRQGDRPIYIIDRQPFNWSLTTWLGVYDLAYAIVLDWEIETRRRYEMALLERYHSQLIKNGVVGYTWQQLLIDYKLCVAMGVYIATEYCRGGLNERRIPVWLPMLKRSLTACDDLNCHTLWNL